MFSVSELVKPSSGNDESGKVVGLQLGGGKEVKVDLATAGLCSSASLFMLLATGVERCMGFCGGYFGDTRLIYCNFAFPEATLVTRCC